MTADVQVLWKRLDDAIAEHASVLKALGEAGIGPVEVTDHLNARGMGYTGQPGGPSWVLDGTP